MGTTFSIEQPVQNGFLKEIAEEAAKTALIWIQRREERVKLQLEEKDLVKNP